MPFRAVAMALFENVVAVLDLGEDNKEFEVEIVRAPAPRARLVGM